MPFLSIIIPVYNAVKYLDATIESILLQSFTDFELLLVNDGSSDGSGLKCDDIRNLDGRITVLHQKNQGVSAARNNGLRHAQGQFVGFIDADDTIESDMYKLLVTNAIKHDADLSICDIRIFKQEMSVSEGGTDNDYNTKTLDKMETLQACLKGTLNWSANNKIFRASLAKSILFEGRMNEDLLYCFKFMMLMDKVSVYAPVAKYNYIKRDSSVSLTGFSDKHMESVSVSKKIHQLVMKNFKTLLPDANILDFISNLSTLNLIILAGKSNYTSQYNIVAGNLVLYKQFLSQKPGITKKQVLGFKLFNLSPTLYSLFFRFYCKYFDTEAGTKVL